MNRRITVDPMLCHGKPCLRGLRYPVESLLERPGGMTFLFDAQLARRFVSWLIDVGHDALHTLDLPKQNLTPHIEIIARANQG